MKTRSLIWLLLALNAPVVAAAVAEVAAPVAVVPYWSYWAAPVLAVVQIIVLFMVKKQVVILERQINSNLEKQIDASIQKAIAQERLRVEQEKHE